MNNTPMAPWQGKPHRQKTSNKETKVTTASTTADVGAPVYPDPKTWKKLGMDLGDPKVKHAADTLIRRRMQKEARDQSVLLLNTYLDKVAAALAPAMQAPFRRLQAALCEGKPIFRAVKVAFPTFSAERIGVTGSKLVKAALDDYAQYQAAEKRAQGFGVGGMGTTGGASSGGGGMDGGASGMGGPGSSAPAGGIQSMATFTGAPAKAMSEAKANVGY